MDYDQTPPQPGVVSGSFGKGGPAMHKKMLVWIVGGLAAVALIVATVIILWPHSNKSSSAVGHKASDIITGAANVSISGTGLTPVAIKVKLNQQVTFTNTDTTPHQITADHDLLPGFDSSDVLNKGDTYTYTFDKKGMFHYYDPAAPKMLTGTVIVE